MEIELKDILNKRNFIIDLRDKYLYDKKHIRDSLNVPYNFLLINPKEYIDFNHEYYLICEYGIKSQIVSKILNNMGYHTYSIKNGIQNYLNH